MTKVKKRLDKIRENPQDVKWKEVLAVLDAYGVNYEKPEGGSHWVVWHDDFEENISVPVHNNRVKVVYVRKILRLIDSIELR